MLYENHSIPLDYAAAGLPQPATECSMTLYCPQEPDSSVVRPKPLVVIAPGGGYELTSDREAEPVALRFTAHNMAALVVRYAVKPDRYPTALCQLASAVRWARQNAERLHIDPNLIYVCGFSAGGHLAASLTVGWNNPALHKWLGCEPEEVRVNGSILSYPVILAEEGKAHRGSLYALYGADAGPEQERAFAVTNHVTADCPPVFLWHTFNDDAVPVENSLELALALRKARVPLELHVYPDGHHGLSIATEAVGEQDTAEMRHIGGWIELAVSWIQRAR